MGMKKIILPKENAKEAAIVREIEVIGVESLKQVIDYLNDEINIDSVSYLLFHLMIVLQLLSSYLHLLFLYLDLQLIY